MGFKVEQNCAQCGATVQLEETDHLIECPYCRVKSFLFAPEFFRFVLPNKAPDKEIIYAPYLRFRGTVYLCQSFTIGHRIVDLTHRGTPVNGLPASLGVRPQAMKMKFVTPETQGTFLTCSQGLTDMLARVGKHTGAPRGGQLLHRAYIGEALSLIYLPLFVNQDTVFDAITKSPIFKLNQSQDTFEGVRDPSPRPGLTFMPTLCPQCGWNLEGERDSVVLTCGNCNTAWEASERGFVQIGMTVVPGRGRDTVHLPFWKISAEADGQGLNSFADFIRLTNQPRVVQEDWENRDISFWSPAFKIRPQIFLRVSGQLTVQQQDFETTDVVPRKGVHPVTLPRSEAAQSLKVILASATLNKKRVFPLLPRVHFTTKDSSLVYLPFTTTGYDLVQQHIRMAINKSALQYGRHL